MNHDDASDPVETWLRAAPVELLDAGFTDAVMRRIQAEERARLDTLDAGYARQRLAARDAVERRQGRWRLLGATVGAGLAVLWWAAARDVPVDMTPAQGAALVAGLLVAAWSLTDGATHAT
jgi:hypothetical protein